ncbi:MAG: TrkH family potassium uptake protein [Actinobacteria bacterium]|nr:TrkH family potassium uptake protein [Actinomycetota bacterium]
MRLRPTISDLKLIGWGIGRVILCVGLIMTVPLLTALVCREWNVCTDFLIGIFACLIFWLGMEITCSTGLELKVSHGLVVVSAGWLMAMVFGAIPHYLSGHFSSFLDACFDVMSGFTTTGLFLLQDLDHISYGLNMWRHVLTYAGGQGIIVVALTFLFTSTSGALSIYVGEGKEEKLLPNVVNTARAIWMISLTYLLIGSLVLFSALKVEGMATGRSFLHSVWLFMGSWSTGGFAPQSLNLLYYHSFVIELITMAVFIIGSLNFALHYSVWTGKRSEIFRNIEIRSFTVTAFIVSLFVSLGFSELSIYTTVTEFFRKGFYTLISGHTTTGNSTIYSTSFLNEFGALALWAIVLAMAVGASAASTGGGFKGLRVGIVAKSVWSDIRRMASPDSAILSEKVHHINDLWIEDPLVRSVTIIILCYVAIYFLGGLLGVAYGYSPSVAFFESVSAGSNTGLSAGLVSPSMPVLIKVYYTLCMWAGRLEFLSVFAFVGLGISFVRGRRVGKP